LFPLCVYQQKELEKCRMLLAGECYCVCVRVELVELKNLEKGGILLTW
jgi:hypothetical protein